MHVSWFDKMAFCNLCYFTPIGSVLEVDLPEILFKDALFLIVLVTFVTDYLINCQNVNLEVVPDTD